MKGILNEKIYIKKAAALLHCLFGVILIIFTITRVVPSDPAAKWAGTRATPDQIEAATIELGLDKPIPVQFCKLYRRLASWRSGLFSENQKSGGQRPENIYSATVELVLIGTVFAMFIGIPLGLYSAKYKNKLMDHISRFFSIGCVSLPVFWVALGLQLVFYSYLGWLPLGGRVSVGVSLSYELPNITGMLIVDSLITGNWVIFEDALKHIILPAVPIALYPIGLVSRMTRSALLEILNEDYITAEKSYGLPDKLVLWVYALKNSLGPTATVVTLSIGYTLMNTFLVESIFNWPGIGKYVTSSVLSMDFPAIMGVTIFSAICYMILNLIADLIIALDPRVRL